MTDNENALMQALENERQARQRSEQRFKSIIENNADGILIVDRHGMVRFVNKAAEALLGRAADELIGELFGFPMTVGDMTEIDVLRKNKAPGVAEMHVTESEWEGQPVYLATLRDVTEKKQAEQALRRHADALHERNKELNCLYGISKLADDPKNALSDILEGAVNILPRSYQYPEIAVGRLILEDRHYTTDGFRETPWRQTREILLHGSRVGCIEVHYLEDRPGADEGPFLKEERALIDAVAARLGHIIERMRAQQQAHRNEQKFRDIFNSSSEAIFIHDIEGHFLEVNAAACRRLGYDRDELLRMKPADIDAHEHADFTSQRMQEVDRKGQLVFESAHRSRDGTIIPVEISSRRVNYEGQTCVLSIARDITERLEKELEYAHILKTSIDGFWVLDREGRLLEVNPAAADMLGYTQKEMLGLHLNDIDATENPEATRQRLQSLREMGYARFETRHRHKTGRLIDVEVSTSAMAHQEKKFVAFTRDVTERKQTEQALRASEEQLSRIIEGTRAGTWEWLVQTGETEFNERWAEMIGYTLEELSPVSVETWTRLSHPEDLEQCEALLEKHFRGELQYYECECRMKHKQGHWVWVQDRGMVIEWDASGRPVRMAGTHIDVSRQKELELEQRDLQYRLQQAQKAESLSRMAGAVAHHFNNQLSAVLGYLELVLHDLPENSQVQANLNEAVQAGRRASHISAQMLTYLGQTFTDKEKLDLSAVCRRHSQTVKETVGRGLNLHLELMTPGPVVEANEKELEQVLSGLILNAWESLNNEADEVRLRSRVIQASELAEHNLYPVDWQPSEAHYACIEVADSGSGISKENLDKIFDPFFSTKFTGRGLGLPSALGMVKAKGGAIGVESRVGRGTTIRIFIPLLRAPGPQARETLDAGQNLEAAQKEHSSPTVLLVEDEAEVLTMVKTMIERFGNSVIPVQSGYEAISILKQRVEEVDCVVTDLSMPDMDGWETITAIRDLSETMPVIVASGYDKASLAERIRQHGPDGFIQKPYQMMELKTKLEQLLGQGEINQEPREEQGCQSTNAPGNAP